MVEENYKSYDGESDNKHCVYHLKDDFIEWLDDKVEDEEHREDLEEQWLHIKASGCPILA